MPAPGTGPLPSNDFEASIDPEPSRHPVQGAGGLEYLEWMARNATEGHFAETYAARAARMLKIHNGRLAKTTTERLEALL